MPSSSLNNECYRDSRDISSFSSPCSTSGPYSISGPYSTSSPCSTSSPSSICSPWSISSPFSTSSLCSTSSPCSTNTTNSSVIEKTLNNPTLGSTLKKRKVVSECRKVKSELDGVLEKYHETLACILLLLFNGIDAEKAKVSETISEVVNLVMDAHGVKKGVTDLLLPTTYQELLKSMCVPDWVLLYFKLQAKLPDAVWQTLLNLTQLGRSGVSLTL